MEGTASSGYTLTTVIGCTWSGACDVMIVVAEIVAVVAGCGNANFTFVVLALGRKPYRHFLAL